MATAPQLLFPWSDSYSVQITLIDSQHKVLVGLINELHQAMVTRTGKEHLGKILSELIKYVRSHFAAEEGLLQSTHYPDSANHQAEHGRFTATVQEFQNKFQKNEVGLTVEVMDFLKDWLVNHIMRVDKQYVPHLHAKGVH